MKKILVSIIFLTLLSGCATWSSGAATKDGKPVAISVSEDQRKAPETIQLIEGDVLDREYSVLADLEVVVNKTTIFHSDPTPEMAGKKLQEEASILGADAVIQVRYGSVGVTAISWGTLEAKGRAVKFKK